MYQLQRLHAGFNVLKRHAVRLTIFSALLAAAIPFGSATAQETAKWFVLRHDKTSDCWTALLIEIEGGYRHAFAQKASGPYNTKTEALKREKDLEQQGTCNKTQEH